MDVNIRKSVTDNLASVGSQQIFSTIEDAMKTNEDIVLPGLGVLFEVLWKNSSNDDKQKIVTTLENSL